MITDNPAAPAADGGRTSTCRIRLNGSDEQFDVARNDLLLLSAIGQGIDYPHNCRVGVCGRCKTRLLQGRISPMVDFALSPLTNEELKDGYILACQAKVRTDLLIDVQLGTQAILPVSMVASRVVRWRRLPGEVIDLRLQLESPLMFNAGQYVTIAASGSFVRRSYSICDAPPDPSGEGAREIGLMIKRLPGGEFSEWLFAEDRTGTRIWVEGPFGMMGIDDEPRDGLCVAGGTGLAPVLSIASDRLARHQATTFTIVLGLRSQQDAFADSYLEALQRLYPTRLRVLRILSHEPADSNWSGLRGLVTAALDDALGIDYRAVSAFVCGSLPMVEAVERVLLRQGVPASRIHADKFLPSR